jgi:hypothetical protein
MEEVIRLKKPSSVDIDRAITQILYELSKYGRSISGNGDAIRVMERSFREQKRNGNIYFSWNNYNRKSVVALEPEVSLVVLNNSKCMLTRKKD